MSLLSRLFGPAPDDRAPVRPLWHRIVAIAREPQWYAKARVADTITGRFDMVTLVLVLVLLRMERDDTLVPASARLTELFVEDMDGQLRESGIGDLVVGKHMGKLMAGLGGRLGAFRDGFAAPDESTLVGAVERNVTFADGGDAAMVAKEMRVIAAELAGLSGPALLAGEIAR